MNAEFTLSPPGPPPGRQTATSVAALERLPLVTLYLTERCNSRCVTCDYWRHGRRDLDLDSVKRLLPDLKHLRTEVALLSGGEPLLNPQWRPIAETLRASGLRLWLLTSGLSLAKHARHLAGLFDAVTVSVDGTDRATYAAIRGLDALDTVCAGVRAAADVGVHVSLRVTVQRANYRQLPRFVTLAHELGAGQVSFLAVDVANPHAFARQDDFRADLALQPGDLDELGDILDVMEREHAADFRSGFIAETPGKLRRLHQYFAAICGSGTYPQVRCNVVEFSAVVGADGRISPCFFIPGPPAEALPPARLLHELNTDPMMQLRRDILQGSRPECARCVCSMWRAPERRAAADFLVPRSSPAIPHSRGP